MKFPVFSQLAGNLAPETGSLETASSSATNCSGGGLRLEPGRDSRSPLRSQGLDYEVQGGNLCKMQAECNLFALTYGSTRDLDFSQVPRSPEPRPATVISALAGKLSPKIS